MLLVTFSGSDRYPPGFAPSGALEQCLYPQPLKLLYGITKLDCITHPVNIYSPPKIPDLSSVWDNFCRSDHPVISAAPSSGNLSSSPGFSIHFVVRVSVPVITLLLNIVTQHLCKQSPGGLFVFGDELVKKTSSFE